MEEKDWGVTARDARCLDGDEMRSLLLPATKIPNSSGEKIRLRHMHP